jgi:hypothetical protein
VVTSTRSKVCELIPETIKRDAIYLVTIRIIYVEFHWCLEVSCELLVKDISIAEDLKGSEWDGMMCCQTQIRLDTIKSGAITPYINMTLLYTQT